MTVMSSDENLQSSPSASEQQDGPSDAGHRAPKFVVGEQLPLVLSREQLAAVIGISVRRLDMVRRLRSHPAIKELLPRVGHPRFQGLAAQAWLDQQPIEAPRRFFKSARTR